MSNVPSKVLKPALKKTNRVTVPSRKPLVATKVIPKKKSPPKKTSATKRPAVAAKKPVTKRASGVNNPKQTANPLVVLPTRMSIRAREKALAWTEEFEKQLHRPAYVLTMTFGLLFVVFGWLLEISDFSFDSTCTDASCVPQQVATVAASQVPTVTLISALPAVINTSERLVIDTERLDQIKGFVESYDTSGTKQVKEIVVNKLQRNVYRVTIPGHQLVPNSYTLRVDAYNVAQNVTTITLGQFSVVSAATLNNTTANNVRGSIAEPSVSGSDLQTPAETITVDSDEMKVTNDPNVTQTHSINNAKPTQTQTVDVDKTDDVVLVKEVDTPLNPATLNPAIPSTIKISSSAVLSGIATVSIDSSVTNFISIYLRRVQSTEKQLAGRTHGSSKTFVLNTRNFPNGEYELFAETSTVNDKTVSNSRQITISNQTEKLKAVVPLTPPVINEERAVLRITSDVIDPVGSPKTQQSEPQPNLTKPETDNVLQQDTSPQIGVSTTQNFDIHEHIKRRTLEKLAKDTDTLDALFTRFAVAIQSGDVDLIRESRQAIANYQRLIVELALANEENRFIADDLSTSLEVELEQIAKKVETFESLRRERLEGSSSTDTDGDGITDIDERVLFGTDPLRADTDGDGFTDGVEIIKGFDPLDAASEAVIVYRSPRETVGITANENLQVTEVIPTVQLANMTDETSESVVQATVRGRALANSFVTLYLFSTPTVVTVRTEADGSFEYTFSKELEDGQHQVFVALTDNTGDIIAQSAPFTFIKQAEAFTKVDAESIVSDSQSGVLQGNQTFAFQTVLSMSVLALGILLILLGIGLRANRPEELIADPAA